MSQFKSQRKGPVTYLPITTERNTDRLEKEMLLKNLIATMERDGNYQSISEGPTRTKFVDRKNRSPIERVNASIHSHIRQRSDKAPPVGIYICHELGILLIKDICSLSIDGFTGKYYFPDWNGGLHEMALGWDFMINECLDVNTVVCIHK